MLRLYPLPNQSVFQKSVKFSTTHLPVSFNSQQPKHMKMAHLMVRVSKKRNLLIEHFACFVTT